MELPADAADAIVEVAPSNPERLLNGQEKAALDVYHQRRQPPLSPDMQARLFSLFLQGIDCMEIVRLNRGVSLGQVIAARVEGRWDEQRQDHLNALLKETRTRLQQTTLEAVDFVTTQLAAAHKLYGDRVKKFLQTGDEKDLGGFSIHGWKGYREAVDLLKTLTGQDAKKHEHKHLHQTDPNQPLPSANRAMTPTEAKQAVKATLKKGGLKR